MERGAGTPVTKSSATEHHTMQRLLHWCCALTLTAAVVQSGCAVHDEELEFGAAEAGYYEEFATQIEYPDVESCNAQDVAATPRPITLQGNTRVQFRDITLQEAVETALTTADVLRDLEGLVLRTPAGTRTVSDPALVETDPLYGVDAALSEFDAMLEASAYFEKNDRALNNQFFGGGTRELTQDLHAYRAQISKQTATGGSFTLRHNIDYDYNNSPGNNDPNLPWDVNLEGEFRQPLFQGAGVEFNRLAGPNSAPGRTNGVLLARLNTDISLSDFEAGVRDFVSDVENAYWELYFAYRDLDAKIAARDQSLETWRRIHTLYVNGRRGGEAENEAQAREQYYRLQEEVENALSGRMLDRTRYDTFRGTGGVYATERRLRMMMGLPASDGLQLRPIDEPIGAKVIFDWHEILVEAMMRRVELRRQKWSIKRGELELKAAKNFLKPRVDAVGRYRWRGLGHDLLDPERQGDSFDNAYQNLTTGNFQEWQLGVEFTAPFGYRKAHAAVRNAELRLARQRAILYEQERQIAHQVSDAYAELDRAYTVMQTNYNRRMAARQQLAALEAIYEDADQNEKTRLLDLTLDAQRRLADAESRYYRSLVEHTMAVKQVHYRKGSLLDYCEVYLSEGPWPGKAYYDACLRECRRGAPLPCGSYRTSPSAVVSQGPYPQDTAPMQFHDMPQPMAPPPDRVLPEGEVVQPPVPQNDMMRLPAPMLQPATGR
jgi:outer membrane protein TolC